MQQDSGSRMAGAGIGRNYVWNVGLRSFFGVGNSDSGYTGSVTLLPKPDAPKPLKTNLDSKHLPVARVSELRG